MNVLADKPAPSPRRLSGPPSAGRQGMRYPRVPASVTHEGPGQAAMMQAVKVASALAPVAVLMMSLAGCSAARSAPVASGGAHKTYTQKGGSVQVRPSSPVPTLVAQPLSSPSGPSKRSAPPPGPSSPPPERSSPTVAIWTTSCEVFTNGSFRLFATNNSGRVQETPGWTVILFDGPEVAGSTATADESVAYGYGAPVLPDRFASPGQTVASNYWWAVGITRLPVTSCRAVTYSGHA